MERKNKRTKSVGNGEGSLYYSEKLQCWIYQYYFNNKRKTLTQRKKETVRDFKARVTELKSKLNNGIYIEKSNHTVLTLAEQHIKNKYNDGTISARTYTRSLETLKEIEKTCSNFCNKPIQKVSIEYIEEAKKEIKKYANSSIDKIWQLLYKAFALASSPSRRIITFNIMNDEELKRPISEKQSKPIKALSRQEVKKLNSILDNEEIDHKYRNIVKLQLITAMRIGEVLARSKGDFNKKDFTLNVHNTLTQDDNYNIILGKHTKTYKKQTQIDEGKRYIPLNMPLFAEALEIIKNQYSRKTTNMHNLLFWDYRKNTFINSTEINN